MSDPVSDFIGYCRKGVHDGNSGELILTIAVPPEHVDEAVKLTKKFGMLLRFGVEVPERKPRAVRGGS